MSRPIARALHCLLIACVLASACSGEDDSSANNGPDDANADVTTTTAAEPVADRTAAAVASGGCGTELATGAEPGVNAERTLTAANLERRFLLTVPDTHDGVEPLPMVFDFHGLAEGADVHANMSGWGAFAAENGVISVIPHGTGDIPRWDGTNDDENQDLQFFDSMMQTLSKELCVDLSRVYTTGLSNGAMISTLLSCARSEVIAAAVLVAGVNDIQPCDQARPVPALVYHGTNDPILLYNGGVDLSSLGITEAIDGPTEAVDLDGEGIPSNVRARATANGCNLEFEETTLTDDVTQRTYDCPDDATVQFNIIASGGHTWPGSEFSAGLESIMGFTTFTVDATADGWDFMQSVVNPAASAEG